MDPPPVHPNPNATLPNPPSSSPPTTTTTAIETSSSSVQSISPSIRDRRVPTTRARILRRKRQRSISLPVSRCNPDLDSKTLIFDYASRMLQLSELFNGKRTEFLELKAHASVLLEGVGPEPELHESDDDEGPSSTSTYSNTTKSSNPSYPDLQLPKLYPSPRKKRRKKKSLLLKTSAAVLVAPPPPPKESLGGKSRKHKSKRSRSSSKKRSGDGSHPILHHGLNKERGVYYCSHCQTKWPEERFRNAQQFGAHCSNCVRSRKVRSPEELNRGAPPSRKSAMPGDEKMKKKKRRARSYSVPAKQAIDSTPRIKHGLNKHLGLYHCSHCGQSWPLAAFRNAQQFGAHCSNCSRQRVVAPPDAVGENEADIAGFRHLLRLGSHM